MHGPGSSRFGAHGSRARSAFAGAGLLALLLFNAGCPQPADLQNPPEGDPPSTGGANPSGGSGGGGATVVCESACITKLFTMGPQCTICHYADMPPDAPSLGKLDLSLGFTARMKNVRAQHVDNDFMPYAAGTCPSDDLLIDTTTPDASWLLKKVRGQQAGCGTAMPPPPATLSTADKKCVEDYVVCVAQKPLTGGTGASTGGGGG